MAKMVDAVCAVAMMALVAHWRSVAVAIASMLRRVMAYSSRCADSICSALASKPPLVRQQIFDPAIQLRGQAREHVLEVGPGVVSIELGRLQQAHHHGGPLAGQLAADEQPIAPSQGPGSNSVLDVVGRP